MLILLIFWLELLFLLSGNNLSRQHGSKLLVDCFILSLHLAKHFINFGFVLFVDSWNNKDPNPGDGEEGEGVENGTNTGCNIQDSSKLGRV